MASALCALPLTACAGLSGGPVEGRVLEANTHKPISDVIVVARWKSHLASYAHGKTVCYHVLTTTTNSEGQYQFPAWKEDITADWQKNIRPERVLIDAYKPGYHFDSVPRDRPNDRVLAPFTGGRGGERLLEIERTKQATVGCADPRANGKSLIPLYRALHDEAKPLAATREEESIVSGFLSWIKIIESSGKR
ncbi:MAG: hypothetical protein A2W18_01165 [Candidatus Muproteobacteria bacterium RBG_16_60_9]|uniref:Carboxypeptidase regulatory-like domain-containing protein n=1 Tax=Candidatus Muproteobacteria bacterium RBG_16_60_9 TaxID=1817755 RepID=A0A1F6VFC4_9PROT|nr:MAG: hypothetical protein A2W18_01165 [Candidatus Muproteobacteria bacterium RBG_16_60_9]